MGRRERPLDPGPLHDFARDLRDLRAGTALTYRALARVAGYAPSVLSAAASGDCLPSRDVLAAFVGACGGDAGSWEERRLHLAEVLRGTAPDRLIPEPPAGPAGNEPGQTASPADSAAGTEDSFSFLDQQPVPSGTGGLRPLAGADPRRAGAAALAGRLGTVPMGQVYLGRTGPGQPVAVTVIRPGLAQGKGFGRRFRRDLRTLAAVRSPFIAPVIGGDAARALPWIATAYTPAVTLASAVRACGPLPPEAACQLAAALSRTLAALHGAGTVHHDLQPSTVLLTADGVQVTCPAIARTAAGATDDAAYTAPDDVFALGSVLAYALAGAPRPPGGTTAGPVTGHPGAPATADALTSQDNNTSSLRDLISACLAQDPAVRPAAGSIASRYLAAVPFPGPGWLPAPVAAMISRQAAAADAALAALPAAPARPRRWRPRPGFRPVKFGLAPLILAGAVILSYAIVQNTNNNQTLGPAPRPPASTPPSAASPSGPSGTSPPASTQPSTGSSPLIAPASQASAPSAPVGKAPLQAAPMLLGAPDFTDYCPATGQGPVQLIAADYAYGWHCSNDNGTGDDANAVCAWTYGLSGGQVTNSIGDFYDPNTWQCWRITSELSPPDFSGYCQSTGHGTASLDGSNAYNWYCADNSTIDAAAACKLTNHTQKMVARFQDFYDPSSWQCWS